MFQQYLISSLAFIQIISASPTITAFEPRNTVPLERREVDPGLVGWYYVSAYDGYTPLSCISTATWTQVGDYGRCCPTTARGCVLMTACSGGSVLIGTTDTLTCSPTAPACIVDYVFNSLGDSQTISWVGCDEPRQAGSFYRTSPVETPAVNSPTISIPATPATTTSTTQSRSPTPPPPTPSSASKAWIAGAAAGPVVGIAIIAGLAFWIFRLKKRPQPPATLQPPALQQQQMGYQPGSPPPLYGHNGGKDSGYGPSAAVSPISETNYPNLHPHSGTAELGPGKTY